MLSSTIIFLLSIRVTFSENSCYWNAECPFLLHSTKTPYDTIRGDIRDYPNPTNCEAVSLWSLHRHGNRNPGNGVTDDIKIIAQLKDEIIESYEAGRSELCAQDIESFRRWTWNETLEVSQSSLTGTGYEEIYDIAKRLRHKYPHLLEASEDKYYFRPTNEQRTITSSMAFVHGLTDGTNLTLSVDGPWERDNIIRPYSNCDRYQELVKGSQELDDQVNAYLNSAEYRAVQNAVQRRLGISYQLTQLDIYALYEICRFYRSWTENLQSPWCAAFSDEDLIILEYRDDVRHYHRNGYGSWVNVNLGGVTLKDLYENFEAAVNGNGKNVVSYFTHDTMLEMVFCAMGIFKDDFIIEGATRNINRMWRTSYISSFSVNIIAVLNRCQESSGQEYRVQLFVNEKETELCPLEGCTWAEFQGKFASFRDANLDFCSLTYRDAEDLTNGAAFSGIALFLMMTQMMLITLWR